MNLLTPIENVLKALTAELALFEARLGVVLHEVEKRAAEAGVEVPTNPHTAPTQPETNIGED